MQIIQNRFNMKEQHYALKKWRDRVVKTKQVKAKCLSIKAKLEYNIKLNVFKQFKAEAASKRLLCMKLHALEEKFNTAQKLHAYQMISSFSTSRKASNWLQKGRAARSMEQWLNTLYRSHKKTHFQTLVENVYYLDTKSVTLSKALKAAHNRSLKNSFNQWRVKDSLLKVAEFHNEEGPVKISKFLYNEQTLHNLVDLAVVKAGYTPEEINKILHEGEDKVDEAQMKVILLLNKIRNQPENTKIMANGLQQWKKWTKMRKLFKYWMKYCENRVVNDQNEQPAMFRAFQKWKYCFNDREEVLNKQPYNEIQDLSVYNQQSIVETTEELESQDNAIEELDSQNRVLIENTISGQKLALSICKDNYKNSVANCFQKWVAYNKKASLEEKEKDLKSNMELIVNLRLKIKELDMDNQDLGEENEQLRKTSMDGIYLAQTWKELSEKIKHLSCDLQDKSQVMQNLLDQNYGLAQNINMMRNRANQVIRNHYQ